VNADAGFRQSILSAASWTLYFHMLQIAEYISLVGYRLYLARFFSSGIAASIWNFAQNNDAATARSTHQTIQRALQLHQLPLLSAP
jgi:hypothetical protein